MSESDSKTPSVDETDTFINDLYNVMRGIKNVELTNDETSVVTKIIEFSNWFNINAPKSLLKVTKGEEYVSALYHLTNLRDNISLAIDSLGKSLSKANMSRCYECVVCNKTISINNSNNIWDSLVSHDHFEQLYIDLIRNKLTFGTSNQESRTDSFLGYGVCPDLDHSESTNTKEKDKLSPRAEGVVNSNLSQSKSDRFLSQSPNLILSISSNASSLVSNVSSRKDPTLDNESTKPKTSQVNGYKFNFPVSYEALISDVLYPDALMKIVSKHDGSVILLIRKNCRNSATCLLCLCDLIVQSKDLSRNQVLNHVCGNRHLKNVTNDVLLANVRGYHDFFVKQELLLQAQGIFFIPQTPTTSRCVLCKAEVSLIFSAFETHIKSTKHRKFVKQTYVKNLANRKYSEVILGILAEYYKFEVAEKPNNETDKGGSSTEIKIKEFLESPVKNITVLKPKEYPVVNARLNGGAGNMRLEGGAFNVKNDTVFKPNVNVRLEGPGVVKNATEFKPKYYPPVDMRPAGSGVQNSRSMLNRKNVNESDSQTEGDIRIKRMEVLKHLQNKLKGPAHRTVRAYANLKSTKLADILPNRYREHLKFFERTAENKYLCVKCQQVVVFDVWQINWHIRSSMHHEKTKTSPVNYTYFCGICERPFEKESTYELHLKEFLESHKKSTALFGESLTEYECLDCYMIVYGDSVSLLKHAIKANKKNREIKLPENVKSLFSDAGKIESEGELMKAEANKVVNQNYATSACCRALTLVVSELHPQCKAYPFGSRISGFGDAHSDLDVFMDIGDMYDGKLNQDTKSQVLLVKTVANLLNKYRNEFDQIASIPTARTPIIKVMHKVTNLDCDMSFRHGLSVENTKFLKYCIKVQPILQPSVLLLKRWSEMCKFKEHISTYALAMMTIFFMQIHNYLPAVSKLRDMSVKPNVLIDGWHRFDDSVPIEAVKKEVTDCDMSLRDFLCSFFKYYSEFDFDNYVICPVVGYPVNKSLFDENGSRLPATEMRTYILKLHDTPEPELFRNRSNLCIQDPFDLSHNLTKACQFFIVEQLKKLSTLMWKHLQSLK